MLFQIIETTLESEIYFSKVNRGVFYLMDLFFDDDNNSEDVDLWLFCKQPKLISKVVVPQTIILLLDLESLFPELGGVSKFLKFFFAAQFVLHCSRNEN